MNVTFYISPPDDDGLCSVFAGKWDVTKSIEKASEAWPCVGIVSPQGDLQAFAGDDEDMQMLKYCRPLKSGMTITGA